MFMSEQTRIHEIYDKLAKWGVNVEAIREMNFSLHYLQVLHDSLNSLLEKDVHEIGQTN
jgi:hypothetical protein